MEHQRWETNSQSENDLSVLFLVCLCWSLTLTDDPLSNQSEQSIVTLMTDEWRGKCLDDELVQRRRRWRSTRRIFTREKSIDDHFLLLWWLDRDRDRSTRQLLLEKFDSFFQTKIFSADTCEHRRSIEATLDWLTVPHCSTLLVSSSIHRRSVLSLDSHWQCLLSSVVGVPCVELWSIERISITRRMKLQRSIVPTRRKRTDRIEVIRRDRRVSIWTRWFRIDEFSLIDHLFD